MNEEIEARMNDEMMRATNWKQTYEIQENIAQTLIYIKYLLLEIRDKLNE